MPPAKPTRLKVLAGETRPSRLRVEPQPREEPPEPPDWLSEAERAVWDRVAEELEAMGLLFSADTGAIAGYVSSEALLDLAQRSLERQGHIIDDPAHPGRLRRNPWLMVRREALDGIARFGSLLALNPAARARIELPLPRTAADEAADALLSS